ARAAGGGAVVQAAAHRAVHGRDRHAGLEFRRPVAAQGRLQQARHLDGRDAFDARQARAVFHHEAGVVDAVRAHPGAHDRLAAGERRGGRAGYRRLRMTAQHGVGFERAQAQEEQAGKRVVGRLVDVADDFRQRARHVLGQQARARRRGAFDGRAREGAAQRLPQAAHEAGDVFLAVDQVDRIAGHAVFREGSVQHDLQAAGARHDVRLLPAVFPLRAVGVDEFHVRFDRHAVELGLHRHAHAGSRLAVRAGRRAQVHLQHVAVDEDRVRNDVVIGFRRLVEPRRAQVRAGGIEQRAVDDE
ncbi:conserved hypothetical protein, partial [Ricinus communis]